MIVYLQLHYLGKFYSLSSTENIEVEVVGTIERQVLHQKLDRLIDQINKERKELEDYEQV